MVHRRLGRTNLDVSPIGFGAFKIGRNEKIKYPTAYDLPDDEQVDRLLNAVLDMGINFIDTAPAYGLSEKRIGDCIGQRRHQFVLSTKVGETFEAGQSTYCYEPDHVRMSIERSLRRLDTDVIDIVFIHSRGDDLELQQKTDIVPTLQDMRRRGLVRAIGLSGKTVAGAQAALQWADVLMVEYHINDRSHEDVITAATARGVGVVCKKGLQSGHLAPGPAIEFVLTNPGVASMVIGGLSVDHLRDNIRTAQRVQPQ